MPYVTWRGDGHCQVTLPISSERSWSRIVHHGDPKSWKSSSNKYMTMLLICHLSMIQALLKVFGCQWLGFLRLWVLNHHNRQLMIVYGLIETLRNGITRKFKGLLHNFRRGALFRPDFQLRKLCNPWKSAFRLLAGIRTRTTGAKRRYTRIGRKIHMMSSYLLLMTFWPMGSRYFNTKWKKCVNRGGDYVKK